MRLMLLLYFANLTQCFTHIMPINILYDKRKSRKQSLCNHDGEVGWPELDVDYDKYKLYNDVYNISYKFKDYKINKTVWNNYSRKGNND